MVAKEPARPQKKTPSRTMYRGAVVGYSELPITSNSTVLNLSSLEMPVNHAKDVCVQCESHPHCNLPRVLLKAPARQKCAEKFASKNCP